MLLVGSRSEFEVWGQERPQEDLAILRPERVEIGHSKDGEARRMESEGL